MRSERGSTTIMAIMTMVVLAVGAGSYHYVTNRNVNIASQYTSGLQAQYSAEAAIAVAYVAGNESVKVVGKSGKNALDEWDDLTKNKTKMTITLPHNMGSADLTVVMKQDSLTLAKTYDVTAISSLSNRVKRMAYNKDMDIITASKKQDKYTPTTVADLIAKGSTWVSSNSYKWKYDTKDKTAPAYSPGFDGGERVWGPLSSQVLFNDDLGLANVGKTGNLQLVFRVNYYITLDKIPSGSGSGSGYGVYYLAKKKIVNNADGTQTVSAGNAGDPTSYVVQYDPGISGAYIAAGAWAPDGGDWGAKYVSGTSAATVTQWPFGAFLVKKVVADNSDGQQNEVWDESGNYSNHFAFRDNNEWTQRYYDTTTTPPLITNSTNIQLSDLSFTTKKGVNTYTYSSYWALRDPSTAPALKPPTITQVPTLFGYNSGDWTGKYHARPPDLRIAYTLGKLAEGNPWFPNTYYPVGAKVAVGEYVADALNNRKVWVAIAAGKSSKTTKPATMNSANTIVQEIDDTGNAGVKWQLQNAPTPQELAEDVLAATRDTSIGANQFSIAKISMADLKYRLDSVNGTIVQTTPYRIPFTMLLGTDNTPTKNKISIELWADSNGNRIHLIRVNDVLALAFNDRAGTAHDIIPVDWETKQVLTDPRGTGIRIWNAAGEFYSAENYGQTVTYTSSVNYGIWGK